VRRKAPNVGATGGSTEPVESLWVERLAEVRSPLPVLDMQFDDIPILEDMIPLHHLPVILFLAPDTGVL